MDCLKPVIENLSEIVEIITLFLDSKGLRAEALFLYGSRAAGTCRMDSDIDIYVQLQKEHESLIETQGEVLYGVKVLHPSFFNGLSHDLERRALSLNLDMRAGVSPTPPKKPRCEGKAYYVNLKDLAH